MATADDASAGDDCFKMEFTLDVVSDICQDVEDVARQGALGNFRKARSMYEEALETHRDKFPVYAEYLRLCLDGGDWTSLAKHLADWKELHSGKVWNDLEISIVALLRAEGDCFTAGSERINKCLASAQRLNRQLRAANFLNFDNEQVWVFLLFASLYCANPESDTRCCDLTPAGIPGPRVLLTINTRLGHGFLAKFSTTQLLGSREFPRGLLLHIRRAQ